MTAGAKDEIDEVVAATPARASSDELPKVKTGIRGLDEVTGGGLPRGRPTLICGSAGCGKTLFGIEFLVKGVTECGEPGVFLAFEESEEELAQNVRSLGYDLDRLAAEGKLAVDYVHVDSSEIEETGEYDLEGLFIRLGAAIDAIGAQRVVLDTIETLFGGLANEAILRSELRRLFRWLKQKGVTAVITAERGEGTLTRQGIEEYVSDCVIVLDHRVDDQVSTRRLRIVKYRGSVHGTNEYPFLIDEDGISVLPVTSLGLEHKASSERVSSGIPRLDAMLGGQGYFRGSSILVSGTAGTGKTSMAALFADAACRRGERCLYFAFEESQSQAARNVRSIGLDLQQWIDRGLLRFHATRPTYYGLEMHLASMLKLIRAVQPHVVVVDPVSNMMSSGTAGQAHAMLLRLVDSLKLAQTTALFTSLTSTGETNLERSDVDISSLIDTWILLRDIELGGERNRGLYVLKSRGMAHSNQIREFLITDQGIVLQDVYVGREGVLTGSMRLAQEAREREDALARQQEQARKRREFERRGSAIEAQIAALEAELGAMREEAVTYSDEVDQEAAQRTSDRASMARSRQTEEGSAIRNSGSLKGGNDHAKSP
jgi:circadian clock protein KaiC